MRRVRFPLTFYVLYRTCDVGKNATVQPSSYTRASHIIFCKLRTNPSFVSACKLYRQTPRHDILKSLSSAVRRAKHAQHALHYTHWDLLASKTLPQFVPMCNRGVVQRIMARGTDYNKHRAEVPV